MKINKQQYIPDQETFESNQANQLTSAQKAKIGKIITPDFEIRRPIDRFIWQSKDKFYNFKKNHVNFYSGTHPFVGQNAAFLPGIEYELNLLKTFNQDSIFLSAKSVGAPSGDETSEAMVNALSSCFGFSSEDLDCNKNHEFSSLQLKRVRKNEKEYDSASTIGICDFVFMGAKTIEQFPDHKAYMDNLSPYFQDAACVFFFNVKYRIFFEENNFSFLSIEPIEIMDSNTYEPDINVMFSEKNDSFRMMPEKIYTKQKKDRKIGFSIYFLIISIAALLIAFFFYRSKISIAPFAIGLAILWLAIFIAELYSKSKK